MAGLVAGGLQIRDDFARDEFTKLHERSWKKANSRTGTKELVESQLQELKAFAETQTTRCGKLTSLVMESYKTRGSADGSGPCYNIDRIQNFEGPHTAQEMPPSMYDTEEDRTKFLLLKAGRKEEKFRERVTGIVDILNQSDSFADVSSKIKTDRLFFDVDEYDFIARSSCWEYRDANFVLDHEEPIKVVDVKFGPPKDLARALAKTRDNQSLKDLNRVTLTFENPRVMMAAYLAIMSQFKITQVKNKHNTSDGNYTEPPNIHINVDLGDGWICEIQLIFKDCLEIKKELHHYYDVKRAKTMLEAGAPPFKGETEAASQKGGGVGGGGGGGGGGGAGGAGGVKAKQGEAQGFWGGEDPGDVWEVLKGEVGRKTSDTLSPDEFVLAVESLFLGGNNVPDADLLLDLVDVDKKGPINKAKFKKFMKAWEDVDKKSFKKEDMGEYLLKACTRAKDVDRAKLHAVESRERLLRKRERMMAAPKKQAMLPKRPTAAPKKQAMLPIKGMGIPSPIRRYPRLIEAVMKGQLEVVRGYIEDGDKVNDSFGPPALFVASKNGHLEIVKLLLEKGADKDISFSVACSTGHLEVAKMLVKEGADKDKADSEGWTPLHKACQKGHLKVAQWLVEEDVDINKTIVGGYTPLDIAIKNGHTNVVEFLRKTEAKANNATLYKKNFCTKIAQLSNKRPLVHRGEWNTADSADFFTPGAREVLDTFACISNQGPDSLSANVISQASTASDVLAVLLLQKDAGVKNPLRVVPLFETLDDLNGAEKVMSELWSNALYRGSIGGKQEIMVGYSDSAKDAGRLAASWAQYEVQERLAALARKEGIELTFFHGKGGTVGRGGNPATFEAILAHPPSTINGRFRVTEQGEMINQNFGHFEIAQRTLDLYTAALLAEKHHERQPMSDEWRRIMDKMSEISCAAYRKIVREDERFVPYFRAATPELTSPG